MSFIIPLLMLTILNDNINCFVVEGNANSRFTPDEALSFVVHVVRNVIKKGDPELGLPVLDPFQFSNAEFDYSGEIIRANTSVSNGKLTGLADFQLMHISFSKSDLFIDSKIIIPSLEFTAEYYELDGALFDAVPIKGRGAMYIKVDNVDLWGQIYLKQSNDGKSILINKIENAGFHVDQIVSQTEFDGNIDGILSAMVEDMLAEYLNRFSAYIVTKFNEQLILKLNPILEQFDTWQIIDNLQV